MTRVAALIMALACWITASGGSLASPSTARAGKVSLRCRDAKDAAIPLSITVEGERATGRYTAPATRPSTLVVINRGYSFDTYAWQWVMRDMARDHGVLVVAMDYRGTISPGDFDFDGKPDYHHKDGARWDGSPKARGWPIAAGALDTNAITRLAQRTCPSIKNTVLFSVSMGVGAGGMALADSDGLYDYWIATEGVASLLEEYHGACMVANSGNDFATAACEDMAKETDNGDPEELRERTLITRRAEIAASGIKGAIFVNAIEDGSVPYDQARQLQIGLRAEGLPTDFFSIGRRDEKSERGTTITSYIGDIDSGMAGHASEVSDTHIVMRIAYDRLWALVEDQDVPGPQREFLVDGDTIYPLH